MKDVYPIVLKKEVRIITLYLFRTSILIQKVKIWPQLLKWLEMR